MKIHELILKLQTLPQDAKVFVRTYEDSNELSEIALLTGDEEDFPYEKGYSWVERIHDGEAEVGNAVILGDNS